MHASYHNNEHALHSAALELKYTHSTHLVDIIAKDEDIRRLRFDIHILEDDNEELRELLQQEEDRSDAFEKMVNENLARAEEAEGQLAEVEVDLRQRVQEMQALLAERAALQHSSEDATAALTEKLALTRELSVLKPELEHLKAQAASSEALMTEKLALQRQLSNIQCELENAKRDTQRALAKRRNTGVEIAQEVQMDDLKRQLAKEKRARQRAEESAESTSGDVQIDDVRKQLAKERKARQKAEDQLAEAHDATQVEDVRKDLLKEKKAKAKLEEELEKLQAELEKEQKAAARATKRADGSAPADGEAEELRNELAKEKKERAKAEKAVQQAASDFEAQKATLDDKLTQFRNKLRSTKDKLKETEAELVAAREATTAAPAKKGTTIKANPKKRSAAQMDPDATTLGTPGDGPAPKRGRKAAAGVGNKSTFTLTPFLNKTTSVIQDDDDDDANDDQIASDAEATPVAAAAKKQPLAEQPASKTNIQPKKATAAQRKPKALPALEMVTEENESEDTAIHKQGQENDNPNPSKTTTLKLKTKTTDGPDATKTVGDPVKQRPKIRKSLADFATFATEPAAEKKKKRKLGGLGKTLFDEDEESATTAATTAGPVSKRGLFGVKGFGGLGAGVGAKKKAGGIGGSFLGGSRGAVGGGGASMMITAGDGSGFVFSPLKKARRNLDDTLRG